MLILDVDGRVHEQRGTKKKDGSAFVIRYQEAKIVRDNHLDRVVKISVPDQGKYETGLYTAAADSFRPGDYERLVMGFIELTPLKEALLAGEKALKSSLRKTGS